MTTPNTKSYNDARWAAIKKYETKGKPDTAFYLDGNGYVTVGYGTLVTKNGVIDSYAKAVVSNASDPVLAQKLVDGFAGSKGTVAEVKASLEGKGFVFEGSKIVGFKDGVDANGKPVITNIKNVLPESGATKVTEGTSFPEKEKLVDRIESRFSTPFTEEQRAAVLSRVYNGVPKDDAIDAFAGEGTPEATLAFFASNRGGENGANPGHYARTIEEAREFLGDSVKAATVGSAKGFTYTDKDGSEVFMGSQAEKIGGITKAEFVAYKVVTRDDQTQTQVPLGLTALGKQGSMQFADAAHLPLDPTVELTNATLSGDPAKILTALTLDPAIKTPQAALDALHRHNPELGEPQDINIGTDAKPVWAKGYVLTDDDGKTTVLAVGQDSKGRAALVGYEIDPVTETTPDSVPHAITVSSPQSHIPVLKVSDAGELSDSNMVVADASDDLPDIGTLPVFGPGTVYADAGGDGGVVSDVGGGVSAANRNTDQTSVPQSQDLAQGIGLFNGLSNLQNWDHLGEVGKLSAVMSFYNSVDGLGAAFGGTGNNLPGDFAEAAGWLNLAQGVQSGDGLIIANAINQVSDQAVDEALNSMLGSSEVPYVSALIALNNLEDNPAQSIGTLAGMYFGGSLGGAIGGLIGGAFGGLFGGGGPPPPPEGAAHFSWDASGHIQHTIDYNQSGGGDVAAKLAAGVQSLLESLVQAINEKNPSSADDVAINPYLIPRVGYSAQTGGAWLEVTMTNGSTFHEPLFSETIAQRLIETLSSSGGLAPAWQIQTLQQRMQHLQEIGADDAQIGREARAGLGGETSNTSQAFALQGHATESANFKSQSFGALIVHVTQHSGVLARVEDLHNTLTQTSEILKDTDNDGYLEKSEWISASDGHGNLQALMVIDQKLNGQIETRDILNLGGNPGQEGNHTEQAEMGRQNADLQRNNVAWLDANEDGILDERDPAFAAIQLWVDLNQDGQMQALEGQSLDALHLESINFKTGQVMYEDGHSDVLTATTLKSATEGVKLSHISRANPDGSWQVLNAGEVLVHEGYQGQVQITDEGGTRWVDKRDPTYEQQALRTGDWEGTADQEAHRHGGGNVEGAPAQTSATGATDFGPVKTVANQTTQSTIAEGDARVVSDAPTQTPAKPSAQSTLSAGDGRIKSDAIPRTSSNTNNIRVSDTRLVFIPSAQTSPSNQIRLVTQNMMESAGSSVWGATGLGVLTAVGMGATASAAEAAAVQANRVSAGSNANPSSNSGNAVDSNNQFPTTVSTFGVTPNMPLTPSTPAEVVVKQAEVFSAPVSVVQGVQTVQTAAISTAASSNASPVFVSSTPVNPVAEAAPVVVVKTVVISSATSSKTSSDPSHATSSAAATSASASTSTDATSTTSSVIASAATGPTLDYPVVIGETLPGTEDVVLRLSQDVLLANDSSPNARADANAPALTITAVADAVNCQVSLNDGVVVFMPNTNFHGEASFTYTVTDQYGLSTTGSTTLVIAAVNDAPVTQGETAQTQEDAAIYFNVADLLSNDRDVDTATDGQVLSITGIAAAQHGTATLLTDGRIRFVPDSNFHGTAQFTYIVNDGNDGNHASNNGSTPATVKVDVIALNDAPVTQPDTASANEDTAIVFTQAELLANDSDVDTATDGQVLTITAVSGATKGAVSMVANGDIRFVPNANYHGSASFTYTVSDGNGGNTDASVRLMVLAVNDSPIALGDVVATQEDSAIVLTSKQLLKNDTDNDMSTDGDVLSISRVFDALHCTATLNTDGTINLVPDAQYHGNVRFSYEITDASGATSTAFVVAGVSAVNDAPVSQSDSFDGTEDTFIMLEQADVLANDTDNDELTDGDSLSVQSVGDASHGTVRLLSSGQIEFLPDANYHGLATFDYVVTDTFGATSTNTVTLSIGAVNDTPLVQGEAENTNEDTALSMDAATLLANDSDVDTITDGQVLSLSAVSSISGKTHGTVSLVTHADGTQTVQFTPDANYHGMASFNYTVSDGNGGYATALATINLAAVNDAPVTVGETSSTDEDVGLIFTQAHLLANDSDVDTVTDDQVLSITAVPGAANGMVSMRVNGDIQFIPSANYHGIAGFTYTVSDGHGGTTDASVRIAVNAINDVPVVKGETVSTDEDTTLWFVPSDLLANDTDVDVASDGQVLSITAVGHATHGTVAFVTQADDSQRIAFKPEANYFGVASYQYTVSDGAGVSSTGTVFVNLEEVNDVPVAQDDSLSGMAEDNALRVSCASLLSNDTDADINNAGWGGVNDSLTVSAVGNATHGSVAFVNGEVVFTPDANYHGAASFAYQVRDLSGAMAQATASFTITALNDAPIAIGETINSSEDTRLILSQGALLQNDTDADIATDGQVLSIKAVSNARHGSVAMNSDGTISFVPDANYFGTASFDYTVDDGNGGAASATATIHLLSVNDAPVATGETIQSLEDQQLTILCSALLQNDTDVDHLQSSLLISRVQSGHGGSAYLNGSGHVVFSPNSNFNGNATFTYWVKDPEGLESNAATATVVVNPVNDAPSAQGEIIYGASEDAIFYINKSRLLDNDSDIDDANSALSLSWVGNASNGTVGLDGNGNVVFTPYANYNGNASFEYRVRDAAGAESPTVQAVIPVAAVNDAPVAVDDQFDTYKNTVISIAFGQLTSNDSDVDGDSLTVSAVRDHANGHASIVDGQVQFQAATGFTGGASFDYLSDDGHGGQTWATAYVNVVAPPNQYATVDYKGGYGYLVDPNRAGRVEVNFSISDDGPVGSVQMVLTSARLNTWGYTWLPIPYFYRGIQYTDYSISMSGDAGVFTVSGPSFDLLETTWTLTDESGLKNVWHFNVYGFGATDGAFFYYTTWNEHSGTYYPPIILDLNGDGLHFTSLQNSQVTVDVNLDGIQDKMAWAGNNDGVLVWDKDHNHRITDVSEFGFQSLKAGAQTDLEGLQALDTNFNGQLDAGDEKFSEFAIWQDANGNGKTDANEFKSLSDLQIASINLKSDGQMRDAGTLLANSGSGESDAVVMGNTTFTRTDGSTGQAADAMLAYEPGHQTTQADAQAAEFVRQALLFNQMCNTASTSDAVPLTFVPIAQEVTVQDLLATLSDNAHHSLQAT